MSKKGMRNIWCNCSGRMDQCLGWSARKYCAEEIRISNVIECAQKEEKEKQLEIAQEQEIERQKESDRKIERAARSCEMEEVAFKQEFENLRVLMCSEKEKASPAGGVLEAARDDLKGQLQCCQKAHGGYVILLDTEKAHLEMNWIAKYQDIYAQVSQKVGRMVQQKRDDNSKSKGSGSMWLERIKLPVFSGNIRDFPRFRSDFEHHILPNLESDEKAAYVFKSCLTGPPFYDVCNVDGDLKEMWKCLNEKYGQPLKLADIVVLTSRI